MPSAGAGHPSEADTRGWVQLSCQAYKINTEGFAEWRDGDKRSRRSCATGVAPFPDMRMAELATYSILWAVYAALVVMFGFWLRRKPYRVVGLAAFVPILLKVFFLDLAQLEQLPRVLATFVLGIMLLAVIRVPTAARIFVSDA